MADKDEDDQSVEEVDVELGVISQSQDNDDDETNRSRLNLYDEAHDGLQSAFLMFCVPDMRDLAKRGELLQGEPEMIARFVDLPTTAYDVHTLFKLNKKLLTENRLKDEERADFYESVLGLEKFKTDPQLNTEAALKQIKIVTFDDVDVENNCVYAVSVNSFTKRVHVTFRGSVTKKDFRQDAKVILATIPNPVKNSSSSSNHHLSEELGVHLGFRDYLYYEANLQSVVKFGKLQHKKKQLGVDEKEMKYKIILNQVCDLLAQHPGYSLYISGHSLGGALATMLALEAAADPVITKDLPVTCITSGAPKVGNLDYMLAFEQLEKDHKLRCIHVANNRDPVTKQPPNGACNPLHAILCQRRSFRHVGLRIKLHKQGYVITFPPKTRTYCGILCCDEMRIGLYCFFILMTVLAAIFCLSACFYIAIPTGICCAYRQLKQQRQHHTQLKYIRRLEYNEESLRKLTIDGLNQERWARPIWRWPVLRIQKGKPFLEDDDFEEEDEEDKKGEVKNQKAKKKSKSKKNEFELVLMNVSE